jgi:hypothetical protein
MVSPEMAEKLLATTDKNRNVQRGWVLTLANEMRCGRWESDNGENIIVSETGKLLDGQHRLFAIIEYGAPVEITIATGAKDRAFRTIDTGHSRKPNEIVAMAGHSSALIVAAAAPLIWRMWHQTGIREPLPATMVLDVVDRYPAMRKWSPLVAAQGLRSRILPPGVFLAALVYLDNIAKTPGVAERFFRGITKGTDLEDGDPILALRNRILQHRLSGGLCNVVTCWPPTARALTAVEDGDEIFRLNIGSGNTMVRPKKFAEHMEKLPKSMSLDDMTPRRGALGGHTHGKYREFVEEVRGLAPSAAWRGEPS